MIMQYSWALGMEFDYSGLLTWVGVILLVILIFAPIVLLVIWFERRSKKNIHDFIQELQKFGMNGRWDERTKKGSVEGEYRGRWLELNFSEIYGEPTVGADAYGGYLSAGISFILSQKIENSNQFSLTARPPDFKKLLRGERIIFSGTPDEFVLQAKELVTSSSKAGGLLKNPPTISLNGQDLTSTWQLQSNYSSPAMVIFNLQCDLADLVEKWGRDRA